MSQAIETQKELWLLSPGEPFICKKFGCGRQLSLFEQLCGGLCIDHSIARGTNIFITRDGRSEIYLDD